MTVVAIEDLAEMIGHRVLVGITYLDARGDVVEQEQFAGTVRAVDPLVSIDRGAGEPFTLPPEPNALARGHPGTYRLRETGETVVDPDFVTTWTVHPPDARDQVDS
jgi:hypothetical protein